MSKNKRFYAFETDTSSRTSVKQFVKLLNQCSLRQANLVRDLTELLPNSDLAHRMSQCDGHKCGSNPCSFACYFGKRSAIGEWLYGIAGRQIVNGEPTIGMELRYLGQAAPAGDLHTLDVRACKKALASTFLEAGRRTGPFFASALITPRFDVWPDGQREWRLVYYLVVSAENIHEDECRLKKAIAVRSSRIGWSSTTMMPRSPIGNASPQPRRASNLPPSGARAGRSSGTPSRYRVP